MVRSRLRNGLRIRRWMICYGDEGESAKLSYGKIMMRDKY